MSLLNMGARTVLSVWSIVDLRWNLGGVMRVQGLMRAVSVALSVVFLLSGGAKLFGLPFELAAFERWGYPVWLMYLTGVLECLGGIGLWVRRWSGRAALGLSGLMVGAVLTHVRHAEWGMMVLAGVMCGLLLLRAWQVRDELCAMCTCGR